MLKGIVQVTPLQDYRLELQFEDEVKSTIDIRSFVKFTGIFAPLKDNSYFQKVQVNPELGTICWPNGADLDPDVLYSQITGETLPNFEEAVNLIRTYKNS
ncbi:MAG: molybdopterin-guanine dinucleotide biosynthesis protein A [Chloroflexi bacterium RBG_16_54_18]|nr:MAG: molybdopterin-guanine dinucleotide biosynthesis protein A [Chloroflexi bacterium RBG_16_54_18]